MQGKTVIPGLVDTHSHVHDYSASDYGAELGGSKLREYPINFKLVKTKEDVINPDFAARLNLKPDGAVIATYKDLLARRTKR